MQNFSRVIILANFEWNREYIAKNLCVKRSEKNNCCQGKCYLEKQILDNTKKEEAPSSSNLKHEEDPPLFYQDYQLHDVVFTEQPQQKNTPYYFTLTQPFSIGVFRPPQS